MMDDQRVGDLPPGFSFDPTDEELVLYYLKSKIASNLPFNIPHLHFSSSDPSQLNGKYFSTSLIKLLSCDQES